MAVSLRLSELVGSTLVNANAGVGIAKPLLSRSTTTTTILRTTLTVKTPITPGQVRTLEPGQTVLRVCVIDDIADQIIGITTTNLGNAGATIGFGVTASLVGQVIPGAGTTSAFDGYLKGIITGVSTDATNSVSTIDVKVVSRVSAAGTETKITMQKEMQLSPSIPLTLYSLSTTLVSTLVHSALALEPLLQRQLTGMINKPCQLTAAQSSGSLWHQDLFLTYMLPTEMVRTTVSTLQLLMIWDPSLELKVHCLRST